MLQLLNNLKGFIGEAYNCFPHLAVQDVESRQTGARRLIVFNLTNSKRNTLM